MSWPKTGAFYYHAQLGHPDKGLGIKGLVVCSSTTTTQKIRTDTYHIHNGGGLKMDFLLQIFFWHLIIIMLVLFQMLSCQCNGKNRFF